ncbi:hypothetical protein MRX96_002823 [Rhipicephalus microplus]
MSMETTTIGSCANKSISDYTSNQNSIDDTPIGFVGSIAESREPAIDKNWHNESVGSATLLNERYISKPEAQQEEARQTQRDNHLRVEETERRRVLRG